MSRGRNLILSAAFFVMPLSAGAQEVRPALEKPLALFFTLDFDRALPLFASAAAGQPDDPVAKTWLAETFRRLGKTDTAILLARQSLAAAPCYSFAHLVIAQSSYQNSDSVLAHVRRAIECDSTDPNGWLMMWGEAIRLGDPGLWQHTLRKLVETGFFTRAALAYGRAELRDLPPDAILLTNGDMDTYPAQAVQAAERYRTDVAVIEREHLGIDWACRFIRDHQRVQLPVTDAELEVMGEIQDSGGDRFSKAQQILQGWIKRKQEGAFARPIALAPTVDEGFYAFDKDHFKDQGMFLLWQEGTVPAEVDTVALRRCLAGIIPDDFVGPWASQKDRSPVRRFYTNRIAKILFRIALTYSVALIGAGRYTEAEENLQWLEVFERSTEIGDVSAAEIGRLREAMKK